MDFNVIDLIQQQRISREDIDCVKGFLERSDKHYVPKNLPEEFIATVLIACSNDTRLTEETICHHFHIKNISPGLFDNRNLDREDLQVALRTTCFASIRWREENIGIIFVKLRDTNYRNCYMEPQLKASNMVIDSMHAECPPDNIVLVQDVAGISIMHMTRLKLDVLKVLFNYMQDGLPVKLKAFHYINSNYVLQKFMSVFKLFMKPELGSKIHIHRGTRGLSDFIPQRYIPKDYGGEFSSMEENHTSVVRRLKDMEAYFADEEAMRKSCFCDV